MGEETDMMLSAMEKVILNKLEKGLLDGIVPSDYHIKADHRIYRKMIVEGIPYFINFPEAEWPSKENVSVDSCFETTEMKLWFLYIHGWKMDDPDVVEYSWPGYEKTQKTQAL
jgi:hypothetical protein